MTIPCSSDPTAGCDNSEIVAAIESASVAIQALLTIENSKLDSIKTSIDNCCTTTNNNLTTMINLLTAINAKT